MLKMSKVTSYTTFWLKLTLECIYLIFIHPANIYLPPIMWKAPKLLSTEIYFAYTLLYTTEQVFESLPFQIFWVKCFKNVKEQETNGMQIICKSTYSNLFSPTAKMKQQCLLIQIFLLVQVLLFINCYRTWIGNRLTTSLESLPISPVWDLKSQIQKMWKYSSVTFMPAFS